MIRRSVRNLTASATTVFAALTLLVVTSCVTFDEESAGSIGARIESSGITTAFSIPDQARILLIALNNTDEEALLTVRPENVRIGWTGVNGGSSGVARAGWLMSPSSLYLRPGEEGTQQIVLRNWYLVMHDFEADIQVTVAQGDARRLVRASVDQDDLFRDPKILYREKKVGKNQPGRSPGVTVGVSGTFYMTSGF